MESSHRKLAERIAHLLYAGESADDERFAALQKSIAQMNERLLKIENDSAASASPMKNSRSFHPSQERFEIPEAAPPQEFAGQIEAEKPCPYEPTGKLCDHCSMCSSRGF